MSASKLITDGNIPVDLSDYLWHGTDLLLRVVEVRQRETRAGRSGWEIAFNVASTAGRTLRQFYAAEGFGVVYLTALLGAAGVTKATALPGRQVVGDVFRELSAGRVFARLVNVRPVQP